MGLTPKRLARILRFRRVWQLAERGPQRNWADVAAELGYADQAHMIKEVRRIGGSTPRTLIAGPPASKTYKRRRSGSG